MSVACTHRLDGFEPDNLLAFLALLGLLRALEANDRTLTDGDKLRPRASWDIDKPPLRPRLLLSREITPEGIADHLERGIGILRPSYDFGGRKDLNYSRGECRELLRHTAVAAHVTNRDYADLLAALMTDALVKDKGDEVDPSPLCLLRGQGQQFFLERLGSAPSQPAPARDKRGKQLTPRPIAGYLVAALFHPWRRADHLTSSFRWDPDEDVRQALMAGDPTDPVYKGGTEHTANRLAAIGFTALTLVPAVRAHRVRPSVVGAAWSADGFSFAWPIWREPATLAAICALLAHPELMEPAALAHLGVDHVVVTRRLSVGKLMNFSRARPLARA